MRPSKGTRGNEKRAPALSVLASAATIVAVFLLALWVFSAPTERGSGFESSMVKSESLQRSEQPTVVESRTPVLKSKPQKDVKSPPHIQDETAVDEFEKTEEPLPKSDIPKKKEKIDKKPDKKPNKKPDKVAEGESKTKSKLDPDKTPKKAPAKQKETPMDDTEFLTEEATLEAIAQEEDLADEVPSTADKGAVTKTKVSDVIEEDEEVLEEKPTKRKVPVVDELPVTEDKAEVSDLDATVDAEDKAELSVEKEANKSSLITQRKKSKEEKIQGIMQKDESAKEKQKDILAELEDGAPSKSNESALATLGGGESVELTEDGEYKWKVCEFDGAQDYIPCLDNTAVIKKLKTTKHFEHRERHCPEGKALPTCLAPLPEGYKVRVDWPDSRDQVWYANVPHDKLVTYKQDQNWVKKRGDYLLFPGGGTQFKLGAMQYINSIQKTWKDISWGKHVRTVLDIGCGVASFGGYLFDKDVLTMSFAPKDEHEAQVQMALERGIPGILSVMGTKRLVFPSNSYDLVHCARCRVPWHGDGGRLLLELNRILRPGGYFVWSATPVYKLKDPEEIEIWKATKRITDAMCWKMLVRTKLDPETSVGMAVFQKPENNSCYDKRKIDEPPMCPADDKADAAWYVDMNDCIHRIPSGDGARAANWPVNWPARLESTPGWLKTIPKGVYGKAASTEFVSDTTHWQHVFAKSYSKACGIKWTRVRNVLDMKAGYGGFAVSLGTQPLWVMNVVPTDEPDTLPIIYDRGLFGVYHDWCESFSTYPRTYDLLHADHVFTSVKKRCSVLTMMIEMDRILRPGGWAIFRDKEELMTEIEKIVKSLHWKVTYTYKSGTQRLLAAQKGVWRPEAAVL